MEPDNPPAEEPRILEERSDSIDLIAAALSKAQASLDLAQLNAKNSFIGSSYADLTSVVETIREPLGKNGLAISQSFVPTEGGTLLATTLLHESGQFIRGYLPLLNVTDWHSLGSAISYARRYSLNAMLGVAPADGSDDDGVRAMGQDKPPAKRKAPAKKAPAKKTSPKEALAEVKKIIKAVEGADGYLRGLGVDPGDPPSNIQKKILELGVDGFVKKLAEHRKKEEAEAIIEEADKVEPLEEKGAA